MKEFLIYGIPINMPSFLAVLLFWAYLFGFKHKMSTNKIILFVVGIGILDAMSRYSIPEGWHNFLSTAITILLLIVIFKINPITSTLSYLAIYYFWVDVLQPAVLYLFNQFGIGIDAIGNSLFLQFVFAYVVILLLAIATLILAKTKFSITFFEEFELLSTTKFALKLDHYKYIAPLFVTVLIISCFSYSALYVDTKLDKNFYFIFNMVTCGAFVCIYLWLNRQVEILKDYKSMVDAYVDKE
ncbi:MAG: hypothetical protein ACM3UU_02970 [Ignavibacteriales bacterium]